MIIAPAWPIAAYGSQEATKQLAPEEKQARKEEIHEMTAFHYIDWMSLNVEDVQVGFVSLAPIFCTPTVTFEPTLEQSAPLTANEHCNLHGMWQSGSVVVEAG
ncbi:MAG: hypothetical protein E4H03_06705 [Myxococcales bacterium]|nr:MAG: hypothetical protein E4H03_06705 [Myxococcales bacterium]